MFFIKGTFLDTPAIGSLRCRTGYLLVDGKETRGFYEDIPDEFSSFPVEDHSGRMITPGLTDLHLHASQYRYCGTAMDVALIDWLSRYAYPEEARFSDPEYARTLYPHFTEDLLHSASTRACIFATIHTDATLELMHLLEDAGLCAYVGKLNIDRNSPEYYREPSVEEGVRETVRWIEACRQAQFKNVAPMITPRFTPSVTDGYMEQLGRLAAEYGLPMQSHLSENTDEIQWVQDLCPDTRFYGETYARYGLFGGNCPTVMAHCIYSSEPELELMRKNQVFIAHCPTSNENVIAGIAPAARYLREGYPIGLGSDISGGHTLNLFAVMASAVQVSKLYWKYVSPEYRPLTLLDAFYMATVGGGAFFGKVGLFEPGYEFDAVVLKDDLSWSPVPMTPEERLERYAYMGSGIAEAKYVRGCRIL